MGQQTTEMAGYSAKEIIPSLLFLAIIALIPAYIAWRKGHSFVAWYAWGLLFWIAAVPMAILQKKTPKQPDREPTSGEPSGG